MVVFVANKVVLTVNDATMPVVHARDLKEFIRKQSQAKNGKVQSRMFYFTEAKNGRLSDTVRKQLSRLFTTT